MYFFSPHTANNICEWGKKMRSEQKAADFCPKIGITVWGWVRGDCRGGDWDKMLESQQNNNFKPRVELSNIRLNTHINKINTRSDKHTHTHTHTDTNIQTQLKEIMKYNEKSYCWTWNAVKIIYSFLIWLINLELFS